MQALTPVEKSSLVAAFAYDSAQRVLAIRFKDSTGSHLHQEVDEETAKKFADAESKGKAWHAYIKGKFVVTEIDAAGAPVPSKAVASV